MKPKISILLAARKNSKFLAKFLFGLMARSGDLREIEVLCMAHEEDTWNRELFAFFSTGRNDPVRFYFESSGLGRGGLAEYFNTLYQHARGDWIIYFCDDHFIVMPDWDIVVLDRVRDLNPSDIYCLIPKFDNVGAMNQILSRGYIETIGGYLGRHGNIDSYINDVNRLAFPDRMDASRSQPHLIRFDEEMFHDFTHDVPNMLSASYSKVKLSARGKALPKYTDHEVQAWIQEDADKLIAATRGGDGSASN